MEEEGRERAERGPEKSTRATINLWPIDMQNQWAMATVASCKLQEGSSSVTWPRGREGVR